MGYLVPKGTAFSMKSTFLAASLGLVVAGSPVAAVADDDAARARSLSPIALTQVLAGYEAYRSGDAAAAVAAWLPVAGVAPHRVQYHLSDLIAHGLGAPADPSEAARILAEAVDHGHAEAQYWRGEVALAAARPAEAARWFALAAEQGIALAQFALALRIESGDAPTQDIAVAADWYRQAAETGMAQAQNNLGVLYANGRLETGGDVQGAAYWLGAAARQGFADAQFNLGALYERGGEVEADGVLAFAWLNLAALQGHKEARMLAQDLVDRLTPAQISQANDLLRSGTLLAPEDR